ncbi:hypothetical protein BDV95DRAFT_593345 [Massariosphaeria phaeospora]|uniref:N-acetyltransferase domain-containing protein n=1 Tax=Massariosphaeria phaeospora TaxID=100035 RepID=A0A7C8I800_9PLEO|nr:hypothetical protein BDV95DRAFT_593345 [Massariosphaeria phaeospora]
MPAIAPPDSLSAVDGQTSTENVKILQVNSCLLTSYILSTVEPRDIEDLVRYCDYPATQDNPLYMAMFPKSSLDTKEEEIMWHTSSLQASFEEDSGACFCKVCTSDGTPVGLALWTLDRPSTQLVKVESKAKSFIPRSLDTYAWREISKRLMLEKRRALKDRSDIWRLNLLSVSPAHQRRGCRSMLLAWGSSPVAVELYKRFRYKTVGKVETSRGTFTSMLREPERAEC